MSEQTRGWYKHDSADNMHKLVAKVKAEARSNADDNVIKVFKHENVADATDKSLANEKLFDIIIKQVESATLIQTLIQSYDDKGYEALEYIKSAFSAGTDPNKLEANHEEYRAIINQTLPEDIDVEQIRTVTNKAFALRNTLKDSTRAIDPKLFSHRHLDGCNT